MFLGALDLRTRDPLPLRENEGRWEADSGSFQKLFL